MIPGCSEFQREALMQGFDEVLERVWPANTVLETHTHPFTVKALVTQGELWLTVDANTQHLVAGSEFAQERDVPHAERYGPDGATYCVARRR
jgi:quercetin dioxygenase-like cupin family protein